MENAILKGLENFILEMGVYFAFLARQKRITIDNEDYYIDLLFYLRKMKRLVLIELKLDKFKPEHKGQVELYLRWLNKYERIEGEDPPLALVLCAEKSSEIVELLELDNTGIHVAQYLTELPPKDILEKKLHDAINRARLMLEQKDIFPYIFVCVFILPSMLYCILPTTLIGLGDYMPLPFNLAAENLV